MNLTKVKALQIVNQLTEAPGDAVYWAGAVGHVANQLADLDKTGDQSTRIARALRIVHQQLTEVMGNEVLKAKV